MLARIIRGSLAHPVIVVVGLAVGVVLGVASYQDVRRDVFPDLSAPIFNVIVQNAAMGAEELETGIAVPLEAALAGLPEVRRIRSTSQLGVTQVTVEFEPDAEYYRARQFVAERVAQVAGRLPPGTETPLISSLTGRLNEIFELTLEADAGVADLMVLRDLAEFEVQTRLLAVRGVSAVERLGGYLRQFQVLLDPDRMIARGITTDEVLHAVQESNRYAAGGVVTQGALEWSVRAIGRAETVEDLRATVVAVRGSTPVVLGDVADVVEAPAVRRGVAHRLHGEVVSCRVVKQFGADTVRVAAGIRAAIADLRGSLPPGVRLRIVYDQSELVHAALAGVGRAVLLGAGFVVAVLFALLGSWRAALLVTLTIPLSIALAGVLLARLGVGLNTMTLGGLAIAVGLLVDASIIVTENILHRVRASGAGEERAQAAEAATLEVGRPITFATLIVIAVFVPLLAIGGIEGRMYRPLAAAVIATLSAALALALTVVPVVARRLVAGDHGGASGDTWLIREVKRLYAPMLDWSLRRATLVRTVSLAVTVPALVLGIRLGTDFMPRLDEGALLLQTVVPTEASLAEVDRLNHRVEDILRGFPEVSDVVRRTGRAERTEDPMPHTLSDVLVLLRPGAGRDVDTLEAAMRKALAAAPGVSVLFTTPLGMRIDEGLGGTPADLAVRIFGPDLETLAELAGHARERLEGVRGLSDLRVEAATGLPQLRITVDRQAAALAGLAPGDVVGALRVGLVGEDYGEVRVGHRRYDLVVRLRPEKRDDIDEVGRLLVDGHDGRRVPLEKVARIEQIFGPAAIRRESGSRRIAVEASVEGRDLGGAAADVRRTLESDLRLPPGYFFDIAGRVEQQARAVRAFTMAAAVAVLTVFLLLYLALGRLSETFVILATLPDAFVGAILALLIAGETWNVSSLVGLIGLFGIAVQNSLVLIAQTRGLVAEGRPFPEAVREASLARVRPKLMTAATAVLALMPMLVLRLHGTEIERPLAIVLVGGLVTSTVFTLLALPTFYLLVHQLSQRWEARSSGGLAP